MIKAFFSSCTDLSQFNSDKNWCIVYTWHISSKITKPG